ncbi:MAG: hypothetical protein IJU76_11675 [Desulfovibrionaceae bacterium]|nr:hypothetical protein [Desulfovibrionaceae bacterium]
MFKFLKNLFKRNDINQEDIIKPVDYNEASYKVNTPTNRTSSENGALAILDQYDFEDACLIYYQYINQHISADNEYEYYMKIKQFVREEFDAAHMVEGYPRNFVEQTCKEGEAWYKGAMTEDSDYKIDGVNGPQQILLGIIYYLMQHNDKLAVKIRCEITKIFYEDLEIYMETQNRNVVGAKSNVSQYIFNRRRRFERLKVIMNDY